MLGLAILFAAALFGFAIGYGTRGVVTRRRRAEYLAYAPYLEASGPHALENAGKIGAGGSETARQHPTSVRTTFSILADRLGFALALGLTLTLLVILLSPRPS